MRECVANTKYVWKVEIPIPSCPARVLRNGCTRVPGHYGSLARYPGTMAPGYRGTRVPGVGTVLEYPHSSIHRRNVARN
eukprot:750920-Rhodomonas_salina.1